MPGVPSQQAELREADRRSRRGTREQLRQELIQAKATCRSQGAGEDRASARPQLQERETSHAEAEIASDGGQESRERTDEGARPGDVRTQEDISRRG